MKKTNSEKGFIAITSVLVISAIVLGIIISIAVQGVSEARNSLVFKKGSETNVLLNGCLEEALLNIRNDEAYLGMINPLIVGNGSCTIAVTGSGNDRGITIIAELTGPPKYTKKILAQIKRSGNSVNLISVNAIE